MAKQLINLGTPNGRDGDTVRVAFGKINDNFSELYVGLDLLNIGSNVRPATSGIHDLGGIDRKWHSLWLDIEGVHIGANKLSVNEQGAVTVNGDVVATPNGDPVQADWSATSGPSSILNKPVLSAVATSNDYRQLSHKPTIPTLTSQLDNDAGFTTFSGSWTDLTNKPTLFNGSYLSLTNRPTLFSGSYLDLVHRPTLFTGSYLDLTNKPSIPHDVNQLTDVDSLLGAGGGGAGDRLVNGVHELVLHVGGAGPYVTFPADDGVHIGVQGGEIAAIGNEVAILSADNAVRLVANGTGARKDWLFGTNGDLTFPSGGKVIGDSQDGTYLQANPGNDGYAGLSSLNGNSWMWTANDGGAYISSSDGATVKSWSFNTDGKLTLPIGGDIVDSNGTTVLGGGTSSIDWRDIGYTVGQVVYDTGTKKLYYANQTFPFGTGYPPSYPGNDKFTLFTAGTGSADRLTNGPYAVVLGSDGGLQLPTGGSISDSGGSINVPNSITIGQKGGIGWINPDNIPPGFPFPDWVDNILVESINDLIIVTHANTTPLSWKFGGDGNLTLAGDLNFTYGGAIFEGGHGISGRSWRTGLNIVGSNTNSTDPVRIYPAGGDGKGLGMGAINVKSDRVEIYGNLQNESTGTFWTFAHDSSLTFPNGSKLDGGTSYKFATDNSVTQYIDLRDTSGRGFYTDGSGYTLRTSSSHSWIFDPNGILNLPNSTTGAPLIQATNEIQLNADGSIFTFGSDGNLYVPNEIRSTAGVGPVTIEANDGTLRTWTFGADGTLTLPGGTTLADDGQPQFTSGRNFRITTDSTGNFTGPSTWEFSEVATSGLILPFGNSIFDAESTFGVKAVIDSSFSVETRTIATSNYWTFGSDGSLTLPNSLWTKTFSALLLPVYGGAPDIGPSYGGDAWTLDVTFTADAHGVVSTTVAQIFPIQNNPGYKSGDTYTFNETVHGIAGYTLTIVLGNVEYPGVAGWTANVSCSPPPASPPTVSSNHAIKISSNNHAWTFGADGSTQFPYYKFPAVAPDNAGQVLLTTSGGLHDLAWTQMNVENLSDVSINLETIASGQAIVYDGFLWHNGYTDKLSNGDYTVSLESDGTLTLPATNAITAKGTPQVGYQIVVTDDFIGLFGGYGTNGDQTQVTWDSTATSFISQIWTPFCVGQPDAMVGWTITSSDNVVSNILVADANQPLYTIVVDNYGIGAYPFTFQSPDYVAGSPNPVKVQANNHTWTFGDDGNLTIPNGKKIQTTAGSGTSYIQMLTDGPGEINLTVAENSGNTQSTWSFSSVGQLLLPEGGTITYTPATASDWNGTAPTTMQEAIDRLAAVVKALNGGTGA